ncbi:hypothetical protein [Ornithinimicrobium kibberense]
MLPAGRSPGRRTPGPQSVAVLGMNSSFRDNLARRIASSAAV